MVSTAGLIHLAAPGSIPGRSSRDGHPSLRSRRRRVIVGVVSSLQTHRSARSAAVMRRFVIHNAAGSAPISVRAPSRAHAGGSSHSPPNLKAVKIRSKLRLGTAVLIAAFLWLASANPGQSQTMPKEIFGKWIVIRVIPATTISCWDDSQARMLLGTEIQYSSEVFRWKNIVTKNPVAKTTVVTAQQFHDQRSGQGRDSSQITFRELGIKANDVTEIVTLHPPANITRETTEIPGDTVLVRDANTLIFAVCNVYFEARRV